MSHEHSSATKCPLHESTDAQRWAREFVELFDTFPVGGAAVDEGLMISWFANAIEAGRSASQRTSPSAIRPNAQPISEVSIPLAEAINTPCPFCGKKPIEGMA